MDNIHQDLNQSRCIEMTRRRKGALTDSLCCCEYIDESGERNHILACCCDCSAIDAACDRLISCKRIPDATLDKMFTTIEDRLRIPWFNGKGAIKVNLDVAIPVVIVPLGILIGTLHSALTILVLVFMPLSLLTAHRIWLRQKRKSRTKLFYAWGFTSVVQMYLTFELVVVSYRKILLWENMLLNTLMILMVYAFYNAKKDPGIIRRNTSQDMVEKLDLMHSQRGNQNHNHNHSKNQNTNNQSSYNSQNSNPTAGNQINYSAESNVKPYEKKENSSESQCADKCCSTDVNIGPVGNLLMQNFGLTEQMINECVDNQNKEYQEMQHVIPPEVVNWVDSRMVKDGSVSMWCKTCRLVKPPRAGHCPVCNACIQNRDHHCIWIDNCIGANNHRSFFIALVLFLISTSYGIHLTLTTVCTPEVYWDWFLFPSDCRYLYADFPTALCFVSAVYSTCAVIGMSAVFATQCLLIAQNVTSHEMHTSTFRRWIKFGVCVGHNSLNKGILMNLLSFIMGGRRRPQQYDMMAHSSCDCV